MLYVSKKTDYALVALAYLAERAGSTASAREIAGTSEMPLALLMNILKTLQHYKVVESTRGVKGGYRLRADLNDVSLWNLMGMLETTERGEEAHDCCERLTQYKVNREPAMHAPVTALQYKLIGFLENVKLSDLVLPGRRIDVPVELVRVKDKQEKESRRRARGPADAANLVEQVAVS
jgi:Rrf2 family protein